VERDVIDASVAAKWYFPEPGSRAATSVLDAAISGSRELVSPDLLTAEFTNVLRKKVRLNECRPDEARTILDLFATDRPRLVESEGLLTRALELALRLDHSVYDCLYVAAAVEHDARLVTADRRLARSSAALLAEVHLISGD
jgi:predicted nucleic acid-binding protein